MTLQYACDVDPAYVSTLLGVGSGKRRTGATVAQFGLCDNHTEVFRQIDRELVEEGWTSAYMGKDPARIQ